MSNPISFAKDICPLFTSIDVAHMSGAFDLSNCDDVRKNAQQILRRLKGEGGALMPPPPEKGGSGPWPVDNVALFQSWIDGGMQP
jgi:hypothetical protein